MKHWIIRIIRTILILVVIVIAWNYYGFQTSHASSSVEIDNIGIGACGAFYEPLINPVDAFNYITFSDMNGIYWSDNKGSTWNRTETTTPLFHACFSENGILYAGGQGLYRSMDKGKSIELIYPKASSVISQITSEDRADRIYASNYQSEYVVCIYSYAGRIFFMTVDGTKERNVSLMSCAEDGTVLMACTLDEEQISSIASENSDLFIHYTTDLDITQWSIDLKFEMAVNDEGICFTDGTDVYLYDYNTETLELVYSAKGSIEDLKFIGENFYFLDKYEEQTDIWYTTDFENYNNLTEQITLSNGHYMYGVEYYFDWHFSMICGNNENSIYIAFSSILETETPFPIGGVIKYDGNEFHWVYDHLNYNYGAFPDMVNGFWDYSEFSGICTDPSDDNHCVVTSITSVYDLYYGDNVHSAQNLRGDEHYDGEVQYVSTTGLDCQTTYFVRENPFDSDHLLLCVTDTGLHISYDGGESFRIFENNGFVGNTYENNCYDAYFDLNIEGKVYGLWGSIHDAPYVPSLNDANAEGYFAVSYDGGVTWDTSYSTGIPVNSIPVKMSVQQNEDSLTIAVATFNNGFYISYDSGKTFESVNEGMETYNGMIWGEDVVLVDNELYCLTAYHTLNGLTPSVLYKVDLINGETVQIDLGEITNARSLTYDSKYGLYINVVPYLKYGWCEDIQDYYYYYDCGGIYHYDGESLTQILEVDSGIYNSAFTSDGTMYAAGRMGTVYVKETGNNEFSIYTDGLFNHLKNICFSLDEKTMYVTTFGGGTYSMPTIEIENVVPEYTVTFVNWDGTVLSEQSVVEGGAAVLPENPTREPDSSYHYTFSKWSDSVDYIESDLTVIARYVYKTHTEVVENIIEATCTEDGYTGDAMCSSCAYVIATGETIPATEHTDGTISSNGDDTHTVYCSVCDGEVRIEACDDTDGDGYCDVCGYKFKVYYTVTFVDWDGTVVSTQTVLEGETVLAPSDLTRAGDAEGSYVFSGWDSDLTDIQSNQTINAVYTFTAHTKEIHSAVDATCTTEGYTGDVYCANCGMLLEEGTAVSMLEHEYGKAVTGNDGTHDLTCTGCDVVGFTAACEDSDVDGYCDICGYVMNVMKFTQVSSFTNGKQYLITGSGYALSSAMTTENVSLTASDSYYVTADDVSEDLLWTYQDGRLYTVYNGKTYYLTVQSGYNSSSVTTITTSWWASIWSYSNGSLYTQTQDWFRKTTKYLSITNQSAKLSTASSSITLYQLEE